MLSAEMFTRVIAGRVAVRTRNVAIKIWRNLSDRRRNGPTARRTAIYFPWCNGSPRHNCLIKYPAGINRTNPGLRFTLKLSHVRFGTYKKQRHH